jgi:lysozyme
VNVRQLISDLTRDEGIRLKPYKDTVGKLTIGIGRNLDDVGLSESEAQVLLANDIAKVSQGLDAAVPSWRLLSEGRQRALANMAFNLGITGLLKFKTMLAAIERQDWQGASRAALASKWAEQVGPRAKRISNLILNGE